jgi:hypothetical protein
MSSSSDSDDTRVGSALIVAVTGLMLPPCLLLFLVYKGWSASDAASIVGVFAGIVGT